MGRFKKTSHSFTITALKFLPNLLLAGEGPFLNLYSVESGSKVCSLQVLTLANIHGLCTFDIDDEVSCLVAVFGGKSYRVVKINFESHKLTPVSEERAMSDWIWDCTWLGPSVGKSGCQSHDSASVDAADIWPECLALALGHNVVARVNWTTGNLLSYVHCDDKCILYCACFVGRDWEHLVLLAGTVYNQVLVWGVNRACKSTQEVLPASPNDCKLIVDEVKEKTQRDEYIMPVLHRLCGHQGVIFSIAYKSNSGMICSASDDRSVRLWKVQFKRDCNSSDTVTHVSLDAWTLNEWLNASIECVGSWFGHTARVWDVILSDNNIFSISEDGSCCMWRYDGAIEKRYDGQKGNSLWSMAVNNKGDTVALTAGDGSLQLWKLSNCVKQNEGAAATAVNHETLKLPCDQVDFPRTVSCLGENFLLAMTNEGVLYRYDVVLKTWGTIMTDEAYRSYTLLSAHPSERLIAVANIHGQLKLITVDGAVLLQKQLYNGKVFSVNWLLTKHMSQESLSSSSASHDQSQGSPFTDDHVLITTGPDGSVDLWLIDGEQISSWRHFRLPYAKQRWVTCGLLVDSLLVCGDRGGSVHTFSLPLKVDERLQSFPKIHGKNGVTDICFHGDMVYTCGRDGHVRVFENKRHEIYPLRAIKLMRGLEWLARFTLTQDGQLLVSGFHSNDLLVLNMSTREQHISIPCGGGHRSWNVTMISQHKMALSYVKCRDIILSTSVIQNSQVIIKSGLHYGQICDFKHIASLFIDAGNKDLLVTAGEDCVVNVIEYDRVHDRLSVIAAIQGHLSNVRSLAVAHLHPSHNVSGEKQSVRNLDCLIFSGGGRGQIKVCSFRTVNLEPCDLRSRSHDHNLRGVRFKVKELSSFMLLPQKKAGQTDQPDTRIMALTALSAGQIGLSQQFVIVAAACSDAALRLFLFDTARNRFHLVAQSSIYKHCLLCVDHFISECRHSPEGSTSQSAEGSTSQSLEGSTRQFLGTGQSFQGKENQKEGNASLHEDLTKTSSNSPNKSAPTCHKNKQLFIASADTGGKVMFWDISQTVYSAVDMLVSREDDKSFSAPVIQLDAPVLEVSMQQSGVNAMDIMRLENGVYQLVTGGDDTSLSVAHVSLCSNSCLATVAKWSKSQMHAAPITGVKIVDENTIITASVDQRITSWVKRGTEEDSLFPWRWNSAVFSHVADISSLCVWPLADNREEAIVATAGIGLQCFTFNQRHESSSLNEGGC